MFRFRNRAARRTGDTEALRLIVLELARDAARRAPDPEGYIASRYAAILAGLDLDDGSGCARLLAWRHYRDTTRQLAGFFAEARAGL